MVYWSASFSEVLVVIFATCTNGFVYDGFAGVARRRCISLQSTNPQNGMSPFFPKNGVSSMNGAQSPSMVPSKISPTGEYFETYDGENDDGYDYEYVEVDENDDEREETLTTESIGDNNSQSYQPSYLRSVNTDQSQQTSSSSTWSAYSAQPKTGSDFDAHPPPPPSDLSILQAHENDVEEDVSTALEQSVSILIAESADSTVGSKSTKFYVESLQKMQIAVSSTERSLTRAAYEKEKAAERIVQIKTKAAKEIAEIETLMLSKLQDSQKTFVAQKADMINTMRADIEVEIDREGVMIDLIKTIDLALTAKSEDVAEYMSIVQEIESVKARIRTGTVADQLILALEKNKELIEIDTKLCNELTVCKDEAESILKEAMRRRKKMEKLSETLKVPDIATAGDSEFDFSQIKEIELLLQEAARSANRSNKVLSDVKSRFDEALLGRMIFTGEKIPERFLDSTKTSQNAKKEQERLQQGSQIKDKMVKKETDVIRDFSSIGKSVMDGALDLFGIPHDEENPMEFHMPWDAAEKDDEKNPTKNLFSSFEKKMKDMKISNPFSDKKKPNDGK